MSYGFLLNVGNSNTAIRRRNAPTSETMVFVEVNPMKINTSPAMITMRMMSRSKRLFLMVTPLFYNLTPL